MEALSETPAADASKKGVCPLPHPPTSGLASDSLSLPSYKDYPTHRPFINTLMHHTPHAHQTHQSNRPSSPSKAFPETSSAAILSALRNLQEKIRRLELEKGHAELSLRATGKDASHRYSQNDRVSQRVFEDQTDGERSSCNQVLITHLAAAESRCVKLERQLDHMRRMLRNARSERTSLLQQQVSVGTTKSSDQQCDAVTERAHMEKLERLEQEYLKLIHTQSNAEMKIRQLEMKLQEEEHQRKLVQDKANQLQTGFEANRILLQSVSPCLSSRQSKEKKSSSRKSSPQQSSFTEPHYRLSLRDVPFVAGTVTRSHGGFSIVTKLYFRLLTAFSSTPPLFPGFLLFSDFQSVGCSHSVRANVQSVLSLLKRHQPHLCNRHVLSNNTDEYGAGGPEHSATSSSSSSASGEELSELLQALQEELRLMSLEQDELMRQVEVSVSERERKELQREQERLLLKMERKGDQISKLYKHKKQIKKLRKEANCRPNSGDEMRAATTAVSRGRPAGAVKLRPGERSKRNLRLLRDMKALQTSLRT
ncbi:uncharacterized protein V6R79_005470 [Siganus canaliculatus]